MHIKEIVVDGFKSYAHRTVIAGFDPHFNAITGLNGSGKSNILDSICFVLGITNLSQVRAGNLHELVYKQGQAGVNKAVVTIHFDNSDPTCSPVGYESSTEVSVTRQVLIGGKSKYLINGHTAQAGQVQNLFHSVQLNVNNPHFLIMQGRITKVLNMKPNEILGMVEEVSSSGREVTLIVYCTTNTIFYSTHPTGRRNSNVRDQEGRRHEDHREEAAQGQRAQQGPERGDHPHP